ncbi:MAG: glycosyltransferase family 2 protein [Candidatus Obscuribacterales bacterium]|nr:glycosyltransferase family 2 protein [Candidatus Obscuribacterales bacterium]
MQNLSANSKLNSSGKSPLVSVVMPVLNEEEALAACIEKIDKTLRAAAIDFEIVVADNGSTDRSVEIAESMGVRVVHQALRGYGNAYLKGFASARGKYLVMGDADDTYDFTLIPQFLEKLEKGYDFVTGSRYAGGGDAQITFLHRYLGNPILTLILNLFFGTSYTDVYCGYRAFTKEAYEKICPVSPGMEFNLELAINAHLAGLKIAEIPITLGPRKGESKLNTLSDGWRSLRMMLIYCPNRVFLFPGSVLFFLGMTLHALLLLHLLQYQGRAFSTVSGTMALTFSVLGFQILSLGLHAKTYSWSRRFDQSNEGLKKFYLHFNLEKGLLTGSFLALFGVAIFAFSIWTWFKSNLQPLSNPEWIPFAATLFIIGCGTVFSSLFISAMAMTKNENLRVRERLRESAADD